MHIQELLIQLAIGFVSLISNFLSAFAGGGAGLVQLPALILFGLPFPMALATHKVASVALGIGAGLRHSKEGIIKPELSFFILVCGLPGVWLGARLALLIPGEIATAVLGLLTLGIGIYSSNRPQLGMNDSSRKPKRFFRLVGGLVLFLIGVLNGSFSSGTGLFVTLWLVTWFGLSYMKAVAYTLILVGLFWNGSGALVLGLSGEIKWEWLPILITCSAIGGYFGAQLSLLKGSTLVKRSFEILSLAMGSSLILRSCIELL